jgi:hypothetical protein
MQESAVDVLKPPPAIPFQRLAVCLDGFRLQSPFFIPDGPLSFIVPPAANLANNVDPLSGDVLLEKTKFQELYQSRGRGWSIGFE